MNIKGILTAALAVALTGAATAAEKIIFDTDMVEDYDDMGALALLHRLADRHE